MRWADGVRFSIDYDRKKIGLGDLNVESSESKIPYLDLNGDNDIFAGELAEASKYVAGFRDEYTIRSGEDALTARENGKLVARFLNLFKINIKNTVPSDNLKVRNKKGFIFHNHSDFTPNYLEDDDNCHIDGTQIRFITKPESILDSMGIDRSKNGTEGLLDSSTLIFDSYTVNNDGEPEETGEMSSFDIKALTFQNLNASTIISHNSVKFQPGIKTVEPFKTVFIHSSGVHTHLCYDYDITQTPAAVNTNPYYPVSDINGKNYEGNYKSNPVIVPNTDILTDGEECFYHVINLTKEIERIFPQATLGNMNSQDNRIIHETGPEYKLSIKIEQWDTDNYAESLHYRKEEHMYTININLGEWFNITKDSSGNKIYDNSAERMSTSSDKPYYNLNNYPSNVADKLLIARNITSTSIYYQRYYHTGNFVTNPITRRNDYLMRFAFKKTTSALNETADPLAPWKGAFPKLSYSIIQTS